MDAAPGRLSTITVCLHCSLSFCAIARATTSVPPPGGNGTTMRTGLSGYAAATAHVAPAMAITAAAPRTRDALIRTDIRCMDHLSPFRVFRGDERAEALR